LSREHCRRPVFTDRAISAYVPADLIPVPSKKFQRFNRYSMWEANLGADRAINGYSNLKERATVVPTGNRGAQIVGVRPAIRVPETRAVARVEFQVSLFSIFCVIRPHPHICCCSAPMHSAAQPPWSRLCGIAVHTSPLVLSPLAPLFR
jgi:hypothetical protein